MPPRSVLRDMLDAKYKAEKEDAKSLDDIGMDNEPEGNYIEGLELLTSILPTRSDVRILDEPGDVERKAFIKPQVDMLVDMNPDKSPIGLVAGLQYLTKTCKLLSNCRSDRGWCAYER